MLRQLLVSIAISVCNIAIHAVVMEAVLRAARAASERATSHPSLQLIAVMTATVSVLMAAHIAEVIVWSLGYAMVDAAPSGTDLVYFAFVNYTTLGYGDVTPAAALALDRADDRDERRAVVRLVDRRDFFDPAENLADRPDQRGIAGSRLWTPAAYPARFYPFTSYCLLRWSPIWTSIMTLSG